MLHIIDAISPNSPTTSDFKISIKKSRKIKNIAVIVDTDSRPKLISVVRRGWEGHILNDIVSSSKRMIADSIQ